MAKQRLLVPLDGSTLAESALVEAVELAKALPAELVLLRVIPPADDVIQSGTMRIAVDEIWSAERARAQKYLQGVAARTDCAGVETSVDVELGSPADTILDFARQHDIGRIVLATHGRTGLTRWVFGSVAEKILRAADRTVVLVRAQRAA